MTSRPAGKGRSGGAPRPGGKARPAQPSAKPRSSQADAKPRATQSGVKQTAVKPSGAKPRTTQSGKQSGSKTRTSSAKASQTKPGRTAGFSVATRRPATKQARSRRTPRRWPRRLALTLVIAFALGAATLVRADWEVHNTFLTTTSHRTDELASELRVVQLTDFHNIPRPAQVRDIVELVRGADPDLIAITGDLINTNNRTLDPVRRLLDGLSGIDAPRYYVDGNHDHWSADHARLHELLERFDVTILTDENTQVSGDFGRLSLIGVDDYFSGNGDIDAAVAGLPDKGFRLVLTHSPEIFGELDRSHIDYAICGHTHGGQIRLPLIGAIYQPGGNWFPKVSKGAYVDGDATLFVDSGLGVTGPKLRLFNQSQVTLHRIGPDV